MIYRVNTNNHASANLIGGKGAQLAQLAQLTDPTIPVPTWFCITTAVFEKIKPLLPNQTTTEASQYQKKIADMSLPNNIQIELEKAITDLLQCSTSQAISIRSSANVEDSNNASYAGQFDTFLGVTDVQTAILNIKQCWASTGSQQATKYQEQNDNAQATKMAVVVQEFIPSDISGVMFTNHPITYASTECVIEASWGLGELIVSGEVIPDHFIIEKNNRIPFAQITKKLGSKKEALFWNIKNKRLVKKPIFRYFQEKYVLNESQVYALIKLGLDLETKLGRPQDIEWAIYENDIYILQSRSITTLHNQND